MVSYDRIVWMNGVTIYDGAVTIHGLWAFRDNKIYLYSMGGWYTKVDGKNDIFFLNRCDPLTDSVLMIVYGDMLFDSKFINHGKK